MQEDFVDELEEGTADRTGNYIRFSAQPDTPRLLPGLDSPEPTSPASSHEPRTNDTSRFGKNAGVSRFAERGVKQLASAEGASEESFFIG